MMLRLAGDSRRLGGDVDVHEHFHSILRPLHSCCKPLIVLVVWQYSSLLCGLASRHSHRQGEKGRAGQELTAREPRKLSAGG